MLATGLLCLCGAGAGSLGAAAWSVTDDLGQVLVLARPAQRIVSLAPGATAMLFAAGAGAQVVGTANYSEEPEAARSIPRIGDSQGFDLERVLALRPDVVVVWSGGTSQASIEQLLRRGLRVYRHQAATLADIPPAVRRFGALAGTASVADATASELAQRIGALRLRHVPGGGSDRQVLLQVWGEPLYTVGGTQLLSDALEYCGYHNAYADLRDVGPAIGVESVLARDPATIIAVAPSPQLGAEWLAAWRKLPALRAVRTGRLLAVNDQRFSRLGPAAIDATEALCEGLAQLPGA
jgi:iron complex transport system substrate-binding protein